MNLQFPAFSVLHLMILMLYGSLLQGTVYAQEKKAYPSVRLYQETPRIDGLFDDEIWKEMVWETGFVQHEPYENRKPSQETGFKIAYDDNNLYVAIRAFDNSPDSIDKRANRKDEPDGDMVGIMIDSYLDHLTSFNFVVSVAGVKSDWIISDDGENEDFTWDPIWYVHTSVDEGGWNAEMKIPFSQIRFGKKDKYIWGLEVVRYIFRKEEMSLWQPIPRNGNGWVHFYGELHGIEKIDPRKQLEIAPYAVAQVERMKSEEGNPFLTGKDHRYSAGIDGKVGVTNDLTLDFTFNPDFGQVEADPSEVNLSAFESYFEEKRPFFIEGRNITSFGLSPGDGDLATQNLFYSRRIGRRPQGSPQLEDNEYYDIPVNTSILGALKLTGKTRSGLSVGLMESVTAEEKAEVDGENGRRFETVEPLTNYLLTRVQKDFNQGATRVGGIFTSTYRDINSHNIDFLHSSAYTGGLDFVHEWKDRKYHFGMRTFISQVNGSPTALLRTQTSSARYFQRPDADYVSLDSSRTSLMGHGGSIELGKYSGNLRYAAFITWKSPGLEVNDMGFNNYSDEALQIFWVGYNQNEPVSIFRMININFNQWTSWDFGGTYQGIGGNVNFYTQFKNYYSIEGMINPNGSALRNTFLRGGPTMRLPGELYAYLGINSDERKKIVGSFRIQGGWEAEQSERATEVELELNTRPFNTLMVSAEPSYSINKPNLQYVKRETYNGEARYLFGRMEQKTFVLSFRINYSITPNMTLQYWGQPFLSTGRFTRFKRITDPLADEYADRFHEFAGNEISFDEINETYHIDENTDGINDYMFNNPDYKSMEFRSNLVMRWEYKPGSLLYLVWSQNRNNWITDGPFTFGKDMQTLFDLHPHNIFLVKFSYRFSL